MIKQISDLSVAELSDLNLSCKFVMDDSNKKTKQISFSIIESKLSSEIQKTVENSLSNYGCNVNFLDYGAALTYHSLKKGQIISSNAMPFDCQIHVPYQFKIFTNCILVDGKDVKNFLMQTIHTDMEADSRFYVNVAYGQNLLINISSDMVGNRDINIVPYLYGRRDANVSEISTLNLQ